MHKIILRLAALLLLVGCSTSSVKPVALSKLQYGITHKEVITQVGQPGKPVFRLSLNNREYFSETYSPSNTYQGYLLLYEDRKLVAITTIENASRIWGSSFGSYRESLPQSARFGTIVTGILASRVDIQNSGFHSVNEAQSAEHQRELQKTIKESGTASLLMPLGIVTMTATAPVSIPLVVAMDSEFDRKRADFIAHVDTIQLGTSEAQAKASLGKPVSEFSIDPKENVLVFDPPPSKIVVSARVSMGFFQDKLLWVAYH